MTSEVKADLKIELSDLNYLCSLASLDCTCFPDMIHTTHDGANYDPLTRVLCPAGKNYYIEELNTLDFTIVGLHGELVLDLNL